MPPNDPAAYGTPALNGPAAMNAAPMPDQPGGMGQDITQCLAGRLQMLSPQEKMALAQAVTPQVAPALIKLVPEIMTLMPRIATMLPGQQSTPPMSGGQPGGPMPGAMPTSPLARTPIVG